MLFFGKKIKLKNNRKLFFFGEFIFFFIKIDYIKIFSQYVPKTNEKQCHHT